MNTNQEIIAREVAPTDSTTQGITVGILVMSALGIGLMSIAINFRADTDLDASLVGLLLLGIVVIMLSLFLSFINRPLEYLLYPNAVEIRRQARKSRHFLLDGTNTEIYQVNIRDLQKIWGSSGFFGYFGRFSHQKLGRIDLYCSARTGIALMKTKEGWIGISPSESFLKKFETLSIEE